MDLARDDLAALRGRRPPRRAIHRRRARAARVRLDAMTPAVPLANMATAAWRPQARQTPAHSGHATVVELSQIPGARQALADYIEILQEWSLRADQGGSAP